MTAVLSLYQSDKPCHVIWSRDKQLYRTPVPITSILLHGDIQVKVLVIYIITIIILLCHQHGYP